MTAATATLTPIGSTTDGVVHATTAPAPCGQPHVRTLCGRTTRAARSYTPGTFVRHTRRGHGGACPGCVQQAGLDRIPSMN